MTNKSSPREKRTIKIMIEMFCRHHHAPTTSLCPDCASLLDYALQRITHCPHKQSRFPNEESRWRAEFEASSRNEEGAMQKHCNRSSDVEIVQNRPSPKGSQGFRPIAALLLAYVPQWAHRARCSLLWAKILATSAIPHSGNGSKPTCAQCPIHCYTPALRARIRQVMRFSGPRMLLAHPLLAALHLKDQLLYPVKRRVQP